MPTFKFRSPTGQIITVPAPPGTTEEQAWQIAQRRAAELEHPPARGRGGPTAPGATTERPVSMGQAFTVGRYRGVPEEIAAKLGGDVQDLDGVLWWRPEGETEWSRLNPQNLDLTDLPRTIGDALGPTIGASAYRLAAQAATTNPFVRAASYGLGGGLGSMANEALQYIDDTQRETLMEQGDRALIDAFVEGTLGPIGDVVGYMARPKPLKAQGQRAAQELEEAVQFQRDNPAFPPPLVADILARTGLNSPVPGVSFPGQAAAGVARQADASSGVLSAQRRDMAGQAQQAVESEFFMPPERRAAGGEALAQTAEAVRQRQVTTPRREWGPGPQAGSYQAEQATRSGLEATRQMVSRQYSGKLADAITQDKPVFRLTPAQSTWEGPTLTKTELEGMGLFDAQGQDFTQAVRKEYEAIPEATGRVARLKQILASVDTEQLNSAQAFNALKNIRTEVGSLMRSDPALRDWKDNPAVGLYRELTEVLKNPVNDAPTYLREFENANLLTEWRMGLRDDTSVRKALKADGAVPFLRELANDPEGVLSPKFQQVLDLAPEGQRNTMRRAVQQEILASDDPMTVVRQMKDRPDPGPYEYLFEGPKERAAFEAEALRLSRFNASPIGRIYDQAIKQYDTLKFALGEIQSPQQARDLWSQLPARDKNMMQEGIIEEAVNSALAPTKGDELVVQPERLSAKIRELKQRGLWDKLSEDQRKRLQGLRSYYRVVLSQTGDVGASLENASVVAAIKDMLLPISPGSFTRGLEAVRTLTVNNLLAKYLVNPRRAQKLIDRIGKKPGQGIPGGLPTILAAPFANTALEEIGDAGIDALMGEE